MTTENPAPYRERLRKIMADFPPLEAHTPSSPIDPTAIYFPRSHAAALDPNRSLVIGNRGMGKSFWANALVGATTRKKIAEVFPEAKLNAGNIHVHYGFAEAEGAVGISRDELELYLSKGVSPELLWRVVTLQQITKITGHTLMSGMARQLEWAAQEPSAVRDILRTADQMLAERSDRIVFVFDQLEQLSDDLDNRRLLSQGILRLALAYKNYRCLRIKIFMRPDQRADDALFNFPDASKIAGEAVVLDWRPLDLYGLLFSRLHCADPQAFKMLSASTGVTEDAIDKRTGLARSLVENEPAQGRVFDQLAGEFMGANKKRGRPYSWLTLHLADALNQVSPRTFLIALRSAAETDPPPRDTAIDFHGIKEGVRQASGNRVMDLKEDYPWVHPALHALKRLLVPCDPADMMDRWREAKIIATLRSETPKEKTPAWLAEAHGDDERSLEALLTAMADIGVIEERRTTGKVDVPDIFRLPADIRRKGGVTPQQRRLVRMR